MYYETEIIWLAEVNVWEASIAYIYRLLFFFHIILICRFFFLYRLLIVCVSLSFNLDDDSYRQFIFSFYYYEHKRNYLMLLLLHMAVCCMWEKHRHVKYVIAQSP